MQIFIDDDPGYNAWRHANPGGYVLNVPRGPRDNHTLYLHQMPCDHLSDSTPHPTSTDLYKICSHDRDRLVTWSKTQVRALKLCPDCPTGHSRMAQP